MAKKGFYPWLKSLFKKQPPASGVYAGPAECVYAGPEMLSPKKNRPGAEDVYAGPEPPEDPVIEDVYAGPEPPEDPVEDTPGEKPECAPKSRKYP